MPHRRHATTKTLGALRATAALSPSASRLTIALLLGALLLGALLLATPLSPAIAAPPKDKPASRKVTLDFDKAPLTEVVRYFANLTGRNFIVARELSQHTITILAPSPVTPEEAWQALVAALSMNGLTMVSQGRFLKIVPAHEQGGQPVHTRARRAPTTSVETRHIPLRHADAWRLAPLLTSLASPGATIVADPRTNSLIIVDHPPSQARLLEVIEALDRPGDAPRVHVLQLENADARQLAPLLESITRQRP